MKRYSGDLATRLPPRPKTRQDRQEWNGELARRVWLLCEHYSIKWSDDNEPDWRLLALKLAFEHVNGLKEEKKRGRKNRTQTEEAIEARIHLLNAVERATDGKSGHSAADTTILKHLRARKKKIPEFFDDKKLNTLRGQLTLARKERSEKAQRYLELAKLLAQPLPLGGMFEAGRYVEPKTASKERTSSKPRKPDPK